jgi:DNA sulfur modification protein DndB
MSNMETTVSLSSMVIPALRAAMGDRVYFVTTLSLSDVAERVSFAKEIHRNESLNELIQRRVNDRRAGAIAEYLLRDDQRFFNALVVGVYGGDPTWQDFGSITPENPADHLHVPAHASEMFGFLQLTGSEQLFAIDGQHRLAGIRQAVREKSSLNDERVAVILIAHHAGDEGLQRTRRLFTVLNKTAKPVLKGDIIALDEDDLMAICTRRLVSTCHYLSRGQVAMRLMNSLPPSDQESWTTITMLYDVLTILFVEAYPACRGERRPPIADLKNQRAPDEVIDAHYEFAVEYFRLLAEGFGPVSVALEGQKPASQVPIHRNADGGHVLYRPLGQKLFTQVAARLCKTSPLGESIDRLSLIPTELAGPPYAGVIWDPLKRTMVTSSPSTSLCRDLLLYMVGLKPTGSIDGLRQRYCDHLGVPRDKAQLPPVVS